MKKASFLIQPSGVQSLREKWGWGRRRNNMDYTKYNFNAIAGAEVEIENQRKIFGKVVCSTDEAVAIQLTKNVGVMRKGETMFLVKETILSLSAKIKVEDMSLRQIKHYAEALKNKNGEKEVYFMVNSDVLPNEENKILFFGTDTIGDRYRTEVWLKFSDTIDCAEWGWSENL
jgi:hypothetical protein